LVPGRSRQRDYPTQVIGGLRHKIAPTPHNRGDVVAGAVACAEHNGSNWMQAHFKFRDHSEISTSPSKRPEQVGILLGIGTHQRSIGNNERETLDVVAREPVQAVQPASAAPQNEAGSASVRDDSGGKPQPSLLRSGVNRSKQAATAESGAFGALVNADVSEATQINH
jgi:hypothetical protein